jgi:hypothetical protein
MSEDHKNKGGFIAFTFSMIFTLVFFVYIVALHPGVKKSSVKTPTEQK